VIHVTEIAFFRTFLLVVAILAFLTATVLDGILMRHLMRPFVRRMDELSGGKGQYPPGLQFMLDHAWARRLYNAVFAAIAFVIWWHLGTPAGTAMVRPGP
jgi:hypothetical protein